jgi:hypothetical protein
MADRAESPERFPMRSNRRLLLKPTFPAKIDDVIDKLKKYSFHIYALHFFKNISLIFTTKFFHLGEGDNFTTYPHLFLIPWTVYLFFIFVNDNLPLSIPWTPFQWKKYLVDRYFFVET